MNHIIINKQISLSKFLVVDKSGQNYVLEFFPGLIEFNTTNALEAMQNSKRQNDSDYYVTKYDFKSITKIYLRKYNHISEISHLFPATSKSVRETYLKYKQRTFPLRQDWIKGLIDGTRETELVIYKDSNMVLSPDPKWPVPKKMHNFYYLAMFSNYDLRSIRDLTGFRVLSKNNFMLC